MLSGAARMIVQSVAALTAMGSSTPAPTPKVYNDRVGPRRRPIVRAIEDRASSIQKLQQQDYLPQPTAKAIMRHRERRRDKRIALNWAAARDEDRILKAMGLT